MRSPMSVWRRMKAHSSSSSGPGLLRIASGMATLPTSCSSAATQHVVELLAVEAEVAADGLGELGHAAEMALEAGMALGQGAQQNVGALALGRRAAGVLLRVHALVGDEQGLARRPVASCGMATAP